MEISSCRIPLESGAIEEKQSKSLLVRRHFLVHHATFLEVLLKTSLPLESVGRLDKNVKVCCCKSFKMDTVVGPNLLIVLLVVVSTYTGLELKCKMLDKSIIVDVGKRKPSVPSVSASVKLQFVLLCPFLDLHWSRRLIHSAFASIISGRKIYSMV